MKTKLKRKMLKENKERGITLIALVITIVVLVILVSVSIAMLTGDNGILSKMDKTKEENEYRNAEEKVKLAITGAKSDDGNMSVEEFLKEIELQGGTLVGTQFPVEAKMEEYRFIIDEHEKIMEFKELNEITGHQKRNVISKDKIGNYIIIPSGFEILNPMECVIDGIVIKDKTHENTKGSEFVWIPVGNIKKEDGTIEKIEINRYIFNSKGQEKGQADKAINNEYNDKYNYKELAISDKGNSVAENIEEFKSKATSSKGYYIGRYEARTATERKNEYDKLTKITEKKEDYIYNYISQIRASELSKNMYKNDNFKSDLINSYAWDTAIVFFQKFDNRNNKNGELKPYSRQNSLNMNDLASWGTSKLEEKDIICNVYDIASNCYEWTTETANDSKIPCVLRGGGYNDSGCTTSYRFSNYKTYALDRYTFRPILYL